MFFICFFSSITTYSNDKDSFVLIMKYCHQVITNPLADAKGLVFYIFKLLCTGLLLLCSHAYAQKENSFVIIDANYTLDFRQGTEPVLVNQNFITNNSNNNWNHISSICDKNGQLLFYTNGNYVWNKNRQIMPNGTLLGTTSHFYAPLILPSLNNPNQYNII